MRPLIRRTKVSESKILWFILKITADKKVPKKQRYIPGFEGQETIEKRSVDVLVLVDGLIWLSWRDTPEVNVALTYSNINKYPFSENKRIYTQVGISSTNIGVQVMSNGMLVQPRIERPSNDEIEGGANKLPYCISY